MLRSICTSRAGSQLLSVRPFVRYRPETKVRSSCSSIFNSAPSKMPGNVEIKAKVANIQEQRDRAKKIADDHYSLLQTDTFFAAPNNGIRLKMREEEDESSNEKRVCLIAYERPDVTGAKFSHYSLTPVKDPSTMMEVLALSNGVLGTVAKKRDAYIVKRNGLSARVHLDQVEGLGDYLEFEVIVADDSQHEEANSFAAFLSTHFGVKDEDTLAGAYFNLLEKRHV